MSTIDIRKQKTRAALINALVQLMEEQNVHSISVKQLCSKAQINRSTFYAHYLDMPDFLEKITQEMAYGLVIIVTDNNENNSILLKEGAAFQRYCKWFQYVRANAPFYKSMLGKNGLPEFSTLLRKQGVEWYISLLRPVMYKFEKKISLDVLANYIVNAHLGLLLQFLEDDMKYSCEYMASQLTMLTFQGSFSLLKILE